MAENQTSFRDRLRLDEDTGAWWDESRRYMMLRPEALMGLFRELPEQSRREALEAFGRSIVRQGGDSARAYQALGAADAQKLLDVIAASAPQLGWGRWTFAPCAHGLKLEVRNSPFAAGYGASQTPVCHAIAGMMEAVGRMALGQPVRVTETACAATGAGACTFDAIPYPNPDAPRG